MSTSPWPPRSGHRRRATAAAEAAVQARTAAGRAITAETAATRAGLPRRRPRHRRPFSANLGVLALALRDSAFVLPMVKTRS